MNIIFTGIIIFVITFLLLSWFAKTNSKKIAKGVRNLIIIFSLLIAIILAVGGRILLSLPLFFLALSALKIKGLTTIQIFQLWRLLQYLRNSGRFSYYGQSDQAQPSSNLSAEEIHLILSDRFKDETFIEILPLNEIPTTKEVVGTNKLIIGVKKGYKNDIICIVSVLDNLVKGAAGQAMQNFNLMNTINEETVLV